MRYPQIDILRLVLSFLVVCIHVPLFGAFLYMPILRNAVPLFYIITGYFLLSEDREIVLSRLNKSLKRYASLWIRYLLVFTILAFVFRIIYQDNEVFGFADFIKFIKLGFGNFASHVTIGDKTFNIGNQIWYLYGGVIALLVLKILRKWWFLRWFNIFVLLCYTVPFFLSWFLGIRTPQFFYLSIPFLYAGMYIREKLEVFGIYSSKKIIITALICIVLIYVEYGLLNCSPHIDAFLFTLPFSCLVFLVTLRIPIHLFTNLTGGGQNIKDNVGHIYLASVYLHVDCRCAKH